MDCNYEWHTLGAKIGQLPEAGTHYCESQKPILCYQLNDGHGSVRGTFKMVKSVVERDGKTKTNKRRIPKIAPSVGNQVDISRVITKIMEYVDNIWNTN